MGQTVYHGVAKNVYVAKEALIGLALGVVAGCGWKYALATQRKIERYYEKMCQLWVCVGIIVQKRKREREKTFETLRAIFLSLL